MKTVYLDQNKWIDLARAYHGKSADPELKKTLKIVLRAAEEETAIFPLSAVHYMEVARIGNPDRRARLGTVMWEISHGKTFASSRAILVYELETALARVHPRVQPRPFSLLSTGAAHAFGVNLPDYSIPEPLRVGRNLTHMGMFEERAQQLIERSLLTGAGPAGTVMPPFGLTSHNQKFKEHLETLHSRVSRLGREQWEDALYALSLADIEEPVNEVLEYHQLPVSAFTSGGKEALTALLNDLPSRRVDLQLHRQVLRNPRLKPKINDLEDWAGLGPAVAHCDVVVCEKHFASLLLRDAFHPRAVVLTDVRALLETL